MPTERDKPFVWPRLLRSLLVGEEACEWSAWFQARHVGYDKMPSDFNPVAWNIEHTDLVRRTVKKLEDDGYTVTVENQNKFTLHGKVGTLSGTPDLVAIKDRRALILDAKTGKPHHADNCQVMLYMWALPLAHPRFKGRRFDGQIIYKNGTSPILLADEVTPEFIQRVAALIKRLCAVEPARKVPSLHDCRFCPITANDCQQRAGADGEQEDGEETDIF